MAGYKIIDFSPLGFAASGKIPGIYNRIMTHTNKACFVTGIKTQDQGGVAWSVSLPDSFLSAFIDGNENVLFIILSDIDNDDVVGDVRYVTKMVITITIDATDTVTRTLVPLNQVGQI